MTIQAPCCLANKQHLSTLMFVDRDGGYHVTRGSRHARINAKACPPAITTDFAASLSGGKPSGITGTVNPDTLR